MFGKNGSNIEASRKDSAKFNLVIEIERYVKVLAKNFFNPNYAIEGTEGAELVALVGLIPH